MSEVVALQRPRYSRRSVIQWVNHTACEIAKENDGRVPDVFLIDARLRREIDANPDLMDRDKFARDSRKFWERMNHKVLTGAGGVRFVPGAFITTGKRVRVQMKHMTAPDMVAWGNVDAEAAANFMKAIAARDAFREQRLREMSVNLDCNSLGEIEAKLHGYVETENDEAAHLGGMDSDDEE